VVYDSEGNEDIPVTYIPGVGQIFGVEYTEAHRGGACGHVFRPGESVYRCRTCGLDETCVMCAPCFRSTDHEGHTTSVSIATSSDSCCDCGDPEAWVVEQHCKIHSLEAGPVKQYEEMPSWMVERLHCVVTTSLDFVLDTLIRSYREPKQLSVDKIREDAARGLAEEESILRIYNQTHTNPLELEKPSMIMYSCILWNDETHSFGEVIERVKSGINCTENTARHIAEEVDRHVSVQRL
jgi:E3 ubiquitin-protein ligase UBR1